MAFPKEQDLKKIREKLNKIEPSRTLPKNATKADKLKYKLCEKFVIHLLKEEISQAELAKQLKMDPARLNEIVKYRIDLFTVDKLLDFVERLNPDINIEVA